jgi:hypothetical protein
MEELIASVKVVEDEEGLVAYARMLFLMLTLFILFNFKIIIISIRSKNHGWTIR